MTDVKRFHPHHPHIEGRDVVLARDYDALSSKLEHAETQRRQMETARFNLEAERDVLREELDQLRGEVSKELRMQILHMRREVVRQDRSPLNVRQRMAGRLTDLLNRWAKEPTTVPANSAPKAATH